MTQLYRVKNEKLVAVSKGSLPREELVEAWIAERPDLLGMDMLIIGRQVATDFGGRIDLLGMDSEGNLILIELKRDRTPRDIVGQVLDYASWIVGLKNTDIFELAQRYRLQQGTCY